MEANAPGLSVSEWQKLRTEAMRVECEARTLTHAGRWLQRSWYTAISGMDKELENLKLEHCYQEVDKLQFRVYGGSSVMSTGEAVFIFDPKGGHFTPSERKRTCPKGAGVDFDCKFILPILCSLSVNSVLGAV